MKGNHHVTQRTDALGNSTNYSYDGYERLNYVTHSADYRTVAYAYDGSQSYDSCPNNYLTNAMGRLALVMFTNGGSEPAYSNKRTYGYEYGYNTAGRVTQQVFLMNYGPGTAQSVNVCASYSWDSQGRPTSVTTPGGTVLNYQYDPVSRLSSISETAGGQTWTAASANYNSASLITSLAYGPNGSQFTENRTYNNLLQMTRATVTGSTGTTLMDMQYIFPSGTNNGKVSQTIDNVLSETVNYTYDALNRLIAATATNSTWGEAYSFDGFGNLQSKTPTVGSAPTGGGANPASNRPIGVTMDANGNNLGTSGAPNAWDTENHLFSSPLNGTQTYYDYDPWGKRVWKEVPPNISAQTPMCEFYFYGLGGQKLETFNCTYVDAYGYPEPGPYASAGINLNFGVGGKLLQSKGVWVATDRQGTVRWNASLGAMNYWPYGEERTSTTNDSEKFGTYMRDGIGQDYADQRYYNSGNGAFWSPDPGGIRTANPRNPGSWNRYMYVLGDPVNNFDPTGRIACDDDTDDGCYDSDGDPDGVGGAGNGSAANATGAFALGVASTGTLANGAASTSGTPANPADATGSVTLPSNTCTNGGDPNKGCAVLTLDTTTVVVTATPDPPVTTTNVVITSSLSSAVAPNLGSAPAPPDDDQPVGPAAANPTYGAYMSCMASQSSAAITNIGPAITLAGAGYLARGLVPKLGVSAGTAGLGSLLVGVLALNAAVASAAQQCSQQTGYVPLGIQLFGANQ